MLDYKKNQCINFLFTFSSSNYQCKKIAIFYTKVSIFSILDRKMNENKVILLTLILCHSSLKVTSLAQKQHAFTKDPFNLLKRTSRTSIEEAQQSKCQFSCFLSLFCSGVWDCSQHPLVADPKMI